MRCAGAGFVECALSFSDERRACVHDFEIKVLHHLFLTRLDDASGFVELWVCSILSTCQEIS